MSIPRVDGLSTDTPVLGRHNHYWALLTMSRDHYFRYRECTGGRRSLEAAFRRKPGCGFGRDFV